MNKAQKREQIAAQYKATPDKPDRQIAAMLGVHHTTVFKVRSEMEGRGEISHVSTRKDTLGRSQPAKKPERMHIAEKPGPAEIQAWTPGAKRQEGAGHPEPRPDPSTP